MSRVELYRVLGDEGRMRVLALTAEDALTVGELASLLEDSQPQISRKASALRRMGLLAARRDGTRTFLSFEESDDAVVLDALHEGQRLCRAEGSLARVSEMVLAREDHGRALFEGEHEDAVAVSSTNDTQGPWRAHLQAVAPLLPRAGLCVDVGCGEGAALDVLAPLYSRVIAVDRSRKRLARCAGHVAARKYAHVSLLEASLGDVELVQAVDRQGGADLVFAGRVLHHASRPRQAVAHLARLCRPGGAVAILEYRPHDDEKMRGEQGDVWLGLDADDIEAAMVAAGLVVKGARDVPATDVGHGPDSHLHWHVVVGERPLSMTVETV